MPDDAPPDFNPNILGVDKAVLFLGASLRLTVYFNDPANNIENGSAYFVCGLNFRYRITELRFNYPTAASGHGVGKAYLEILYVVCLTMIGIGYMVAKYFWGKSDKRKGRP